MARNELQKLKRRELLKMLLVQCQETERLERELSEITSEHEMMTESYERLKSKLNVKDERLNQKDAQIAELRNTIAEMKRSRVIELEDAGSIAEAALRLNGVFEAAQRAAEQYLMNVKRISEQSPDILDVPEEQKEIPAFEEVGWRAGIRRKAGASRIRQMVPGGTPFINADAERSVRTCGKDGDEQRVLAAVPGGVHG